MKNSRDFFGANAKEKRMSKFSVNEANIDDIQIPSNMIKERAYALTITMFTSFKAKVDSVNQNSILHIS